MHKKIAFLVSFVYLSTVVPIIPSIPLFILPISYIIILFIVFKKQIIGIDNFILSFLIVCIFSILFNNIPSYFRTEQRFLIFVMSLLVFSPLIKSHLLNDIKRNMFNYTNLFILIITVLSFLGRVTGVYNGRDWAGGFSGLTKLSMILAPFSAISMLYAIFRMYKAKGNSRKMFFISTLISFFTLLIAGSRIALVGGVLGIVIFFMSYFGNNILAKIKVFKRLILVVLLTSPLWFTFLGTLSHKIEYSNNKGSAIATREILWKHRYDEFFESPIIGIGYSHAKYGIINKENGVIEPGTSWGVVFAMTGLLGGLIFLLFIVSQVKFLYFNKKDRLVSSFLLSLLGFFIIHWIAEGYILSSGAYLFFYSWLLLGVIDANKITTKKLIKTQTYFEK